MLCHAVCWKRMQACRVRFAHYQRRKMRIIARRYGSGKKTIRMHLVRHQRNKRGQKSSDEVWIQSLNQLLYKNFLWDSYKIHFQRKVRNSQRMLVRRRIGVLFSETNENDNRRERNGQQNLHGCNKRVQSISRYVRNDNSNLFQPCDNIQGKYLNKYESKIEFVM